MSILYILHAYFFSYIPYSTVWYVTLWAEYVVWDLMVGLFPSEA